MRMDISQARYLRRLPSFSSSEPGSVKSYSIRPWLTSSQAIRVAFCVRRFSTNGGAPAIICRARRAASTTYANWLCGALVCTVISVLPSKRCKQLVHECAAPFARATQRQYNRLRFTTRTFHVVVHHTKIIKLLAGHNFIARLGQPPGNLFVAILAATAQAPLEFLARRRQNENRHGLRQFFLHLRRTLHIDLKDQVEPPLPSLLQPFLRGTVRMLAEDTGILQKLAPGYHGGKLSLGDEIITLSTGFSRPSRPSGI